MKYTVTWTPSAEQDLAALWNAAPDRQAVADAADEIDTSLARDPFGQSESRGGQTRFLFAPPLAVLYDVDQAARSVRVWAVWRPRRRR